MGTVPVMVVMVASGDGGVVMMVATGDGDDGS